MFMLDAWLDAWVWSEGSGGCLAPGLIRQGRWGRKFGQVDSSKAWPAPLVEAAHTQPLRLCTRRPLGQLQLWLAASGALSAQCAAPGSNHCRRCLPLFFPANTPVMADASMASRFSSVMELVRLRFAQSSLRMSLQWV